MRAYDILGRAIVNGEANRSNVSRSPYYLGNAKALASLFFNIDAKAHRHLRSPVVVGDRDKYWLRLNFHFEGPAGVFERTFPTVFCSKITVGIVLFYKTFP